MTATILPEDDTKAATLATWGDLNPTLHQNIQCSWQNTKKPTGNDYIFDLSVKIGEKSHRTREIVVGPFSTLVITQTLTKMALRLAPQLFEKDPRIGISIMKGEKFPRAPLFDRPIPQDPRTEAANFLRNGISRPCPFCSKILDNNVLWCGGNVGYAHGECAPWVKPNTTY